MIAFVPHNASQSYIITHLLSLSVTYVINFGMQGELRVDSRGCQDVLTPDIKVCMCMLVPEVSHTLTPLTKNLDLLLGELVPSPT